MFEVCRLPRVWDSGTRQIAVTLQRITKASHNMAQIYVNGEAQDVSLPLTVNELIRQQQVETPEMVSVQVNEEFAEREQWDDIIIKEGDSVDFLYFMGGGR